MAERLADELQVVGVPAASPRTGSGARRAARRGCRGCGRSWGRVAAAQAQPAGQAQQRQRPCHGFMRSRSCAGASTPARAQLLMGGKCGHPVLVEHQPEHLPGIAFQRRQATVEEQSPGTVSCRLPLKRKPSAWAGQSRGRWNGAQGLSARPRTDLASAMGPRCVVRCRPRPSVNQSLIDPVLDRGPDHRQRAATCLRPGPLRHRGMRFHLRDRRFLLLVTAFHCRHSSVSRSRPARGGALALWQAEDSRRSATSWWVRP